MESGRVLPEGIVEVVQDLVEVAVEDFVEAIESAAFAFEEQVRIIEGGAVHDAVGFGLGGEFLEPLTLRVRPLAGGEDGLQGIVHALVIGLQGITQGGLTDVADDAGGDFLVREFLVGGGEAGLGETGLVEFILKLAKLVFVVGDQDRLRGAVALAVEDFA